MLAKNLRLWLSFHKKAAKQSFNSLCRTPLATTTIIFVIAITLTLPAIFFLITMNTQRLVGSLPQAGHITLFLKSSMAASETTDFLNRVRHLPGVEKATLTSAAQGLAELQKQEGMEDIIKYLPENPLPAVIEVDPSFDANNTEKLQLLYGQLKAYPQVDQAKLDLQWAQRLCAIFKATGSLTEGLMILLALTVILIIGNTLRLAIQSRQEEIKVLALIGAKDTYIVRPFLYTGIWYGLAGAVVSVMLVTFFRFSLAAAMKQLLTVYEMPFILQGLSIGQMSFFLVMAASLGWIGARIAVKRQLIIMRK